MEQYAYAIQLLHYLCKDAYIDGIDFWGPKLVLSRTRQNEMKVSAQIAFTIKGPITLQNQNGTYTSTQSNEEQKLYLLSSLRRKEIKKVKLNEETLDIELIFNDSSLIIHGDNGLFESWKLDTYCGLDYIGVIACPGGKLSVFTPEDETVKDTNCYAYFYFHSDDAIVDVDEFAKLLPINQKGSYSKGDKWQHTKSPYEYRQWSSIELNSDDSSHYDGTQTFAKFFEMLKSKQREIIYLKEKYNMDLGVHFVLTINSNEMPYFKLKMDTKFIYLVVEKLKLKS